MIKRKLKQFALAIAVATAWAVPVFAQATAPIGDECADGGGIPVSVQVNNNNCVPKATEGNLASNPIVVWLSDIILFLTVGVGLVSVGGIVYGAVLYASARDNAAQTKQGVDIIRNTVIGLLLYLIMFGALNFLIPGGVLE